MSVSKIIYLVAIIACTMPFVGTPLALMLGIFLAQTVKHPFPAKSKKLTHWLLQASVVGLGFGMNAWQAVEVGKQGIWLTIFSITITLTIGLYLGKFMKVEKKTSYMISTGTAICGGSAIAAVSSLIRSNEKQISTALGTVFILNSLALLLFPWIGHHIHLSQHQFGVWAAIAIHDTSSVVGAAQQYGAEALQTATTIKLERALWIIPFSFLSMLIFKNDDGKIKIPYFILLFVMAMFVNTFVPALHSGASFIVTISKIGLKITLFLIGSGLTKELLKSVGLKPLFQGAVLWLIISSVSLALIVYAVA